MPRQEIFIGSANESKELASKIAQELANKGFKPRRWWDEFPAGSVALDQLREIAQSVDGAVLIGDGIDTVQVRGSKSSAPRDNVVLEYGLFAGSLGRECTLFALTPSTTVPSDIRGITVVYIDDDLSSTAERITDHFVSVFGKRHTPPHTSTRIIADPSLAHRLFSGPSPEWHQRDLYFGLEGAKCWIELSSSNDYIGSAAGWTRNAAIEAIKHVRIRTLVSLGPGDGRLDSSMVAELARHEPHAQYIPIDISDALLQRAIANLGETVSIPSGILGDFEQGISFINREISSLKKRPVLYSLLGGTLGNLDKAEEREFLNGLATLIEPGDYLLLMIGVKGPSWSFEHDPRRDIHSLPEQFKRFIASGISKRTAIPINVVLEKFDTCVVSKERTNHDVADSVSIEYFWTGLEDEADHHSRWLCTRICRYNFEGLIETLKETGFSLLRSMRYGEDTSADTDVLDYAMILLERAD